VLRHGHLWEEERHSFGRSDLRGKGRIDSVAFMGVLLIFVSVEREHTI
jgi:hypothetical protein